MNQEPQEVETTYQMGRLAPPSVEELNHQIPGYEFISFIDRGGMGAVYLAKQKTLNRLVAVKILPDALCTRKAFATRFLQEARLQAGMSHPHIVAVYDYGEAAGGRLYYVMEYIKGTNLRQLMHRGELHPKKMLAVVGQLCSALQYSHDHGVIHRDVKPANVLIDDKGNVKLVDFGLAKKLELVPEGPGLTAASDAVGTPDYIAPEAIAMNGKVDHRADIYSLGVMLYEMLTGSVPKGAWESPSRAAGADVRFDSVVRKALQPNPERRFQQVMEVTRVIEDLMDGRGSSVDVDGPLPAPRPLPATRKPVRAWGMGVLFFLIVVVGGKALVDGFQTPVQPQPAVVTPVIAPSVPAVSPAQQAQMNLAQWVTNRGGAVNVSLPLQTDRTLGPGSDISAPENLPDGDYYVWRVSISSCSDFTDEDLAGLVKLCEAADTVSNLNLDRAKIAPSSLSQIIRLAPTLTHLRLTNTQSFSNESIHYLKLCNKLSHLYVTTRESDPFELDVGQDIRLVQKMQELLPDCRITVE
ncbi:MAG: serine/threonine-protein kinase [Verrucomicrobium sp.]|nr:serine/threonine-protein kinase [Verrucomicrobium sp.]